MMLMLSRKLRESITLIDKATNRTIATIQYAENKGREIVRFAIDAPDDVMILRTELLDKAEDRYQERRERGERPR